MCDTWCILDPKTGEILKDKEDTPLKFVSQSLRAKCPINSSSGFKDEPQMQALLLEAENIHDEWKEKMGGTTRKIAELEVSLRKRELKDLLYNLALSMIEAKMIERRIINDMPASEVTNKDYASLITYSLVGNLTDLQVSRFGFTKATGTSFAADNMDDEAQNNQSGPPSLQHRLDHDEEDQTRQTCHQIQE